MFLYQKPPFVKNISNLVNLAKYFFGTCFPCSILNFTHYLHLPRTISSQNVFGILNRNSLVKMLTRTCSISISTIKCAVKSNITFNAKHSENSQPHMFQKSSLFSQRKCSVRVIHHHPNKNSQFRSFLRLHDIPRLILIFYCIVSIFKTIIDTIFGYSLRYNIEIVASKM